MKCLVFVLLLLPCTALSANLNFQTLLFYTCVTPQIGNQCEEGFTLDQVGVATRGFSSNITTIKAGRAAGNITTFFAVHDTFFSNGKGLNPDWEKEWDSLQAELEPLIQDRTVVGFFLGDELLEGKISLSDLTTALDALQKTKQRFPWLLTWENEGGTSWMKHFAKTGIPASLDIISLDDYYLWANNIDTPSAQVAGHRYLYETSIYPMLHPHQSVFIVPGSFGTRDPRKPGTKGYPHGNRTYCYDGTFSGCDHYMSAEASGYASWAEEDPRVAGIAPWHWDTRPIGVVTPYKEVGVVDMPLTRKTWKEVGEKIRSGPASKHPQFNQLSLASPPPPSPLLKPPPSSVEAFTSGKEGYHTYRIPAVVHNPTTGDLLMFAEGRKVSSSDHGWNDIVMKKSSDNGASWSKIKVVYSESKPGHSVCIGNPSPIALASGEVILVACRNNKQVITLRSTDAGSSWGEPKEISHQVVPKAWQWIATGPPQGLELTPGGRLLVAADHMNGSVWGSHSMYSDDGGVSWVISESIPGGNECQAAQINETHLVMNMRTRPVH